MATERQTVISFSRPSVVVDWLACPHPSPPGLFPQGWCGILEFQSSKSTGNPHCDCLPLRRRLRCRHGNALLDVTELAQAKSLGSTAVPTHSLGNASFCTEGDCLSKGRLSPTGPCCSHGAGSGTRAQNNGPPPGLLGLRAFSPASLTNFCSHQPRSGEIPLPGFRSPTPPTNHHNTTHRQLFVKGAKTQRHGTRDSWATNQQVTKGTASRFPAIQVAWLSRGVARVPGPPSRPLCKLAPLITELRPLADPHFSSRPRRRRVLSWPH